MKSLIISSYVGSYHTLRPEAEMMLGLKNRGVDVEVVSPVNHPWPAKFTEAGIKVHNLYPKRKIDINVIRRIRNILKKGKHDILHTLENKGIANGNFAAIGLLVKVITYRGIDLKRTDPTYWLTHLHPRVNCVICLSKAVQKNIEQNLLFKNTQTRQIYKGQEATWFKHVKPASKRGLGLPENAFLVTMVANIRPFKGAEYFVETAKYLPKQLPIYMLLVGQDSDNEKFQQMNRKNNTTDKLKLVGPRQDALDIVKASDVFALTTVGLEGLCRALMEAMTMGIACISTKSGGPEELIVHNESGILIEKRNPKLLAEKITYLYHNPQERQLLASGAAKRMQTHFSIDKAVSETYQLYQDLLASR